MNRNEPAAQTCIGITRSLSQSLRPIDAHVHVWTDDTAAYPFGPHDGLAAPTRPYPADALLRAMDEAGVAQALAIQPRVYGYDHGYLLMAALNRTERLRVMPLINVMRPSALREIETLATHPAVAGFRVIVTGSRGTTAMLDEPATQVWSRLSEHGQPVGFLANPQTIPVIEDIAKHQPDLPIVVDHLASVDAKSWHDWGPRLLRMSERRNIYVKLSALGHLSALPSPHADMLRAVHQLLQCYGAGRLLWGSDWPHVYGYGTYEDSLHALTTALSGATNKELDLILAGTAQSLFGFPAQPPR